MYRRGFYKDQQVDADLEDHKIYKLSIRTSCVWTLKSLWINYKQPNMYNTTFHANESSL